ncbi:MAG: NTP transferase domain-containing protein [Candidatus Cloacimonetes bacterium]|nr:NTP transferase domain-containing protein [Candidatus Cloacimonadota bacterium]MCB5286625.1 NTP transferase domain-containing protein [Candidatus Cloacimonadota bacterium]MCK9185122.1 NTP transferase domain-containing protein [Candidatus Cloacimonadota bacterium]MCK9583566.1 NTP transferase domain-containing protein [Candidatus Cloacimonadota bacterium]MDY0228945.1 NTP transferase domain-containing protein [Candidatus Cloacimonadaceae bacterium]
MQTSIPYKVTAIILASGKGLRYGQPKSEASIDGKLFSQKISASLLDAGIRDIVLADDEDTASPLDTLRAAVSKLETKPDFYLIFPVDHPFVSSETISILLGTAFQNPDCVIKPEFRGQRGHPIIIPSTLNIYAEAEAGLREIIRYSSIATVIVPVEDAGIMQNVNYLQDTV